MALISGWRRPSTLVFAAVWAANGALAVANLAAPGAAEEPPQAWRQPEAPLPMQTMTPTPLQSAGAAPSDPPPAAVGPPAPAPVSPQPSAVLETEEAAGSGEVPASMPAARVCRAWGPLGDVDSAVALGRMLGLGEKDYELFAAEEVERRNYLVRVRTIGTRAKANQVLQELDALSIDAHLMEAGSQGYALAAGVFSNSSRAESQQRRLVDLGYDADVEPLERRRQVYYLLGRVPGYSDPEIPDVGACEGVAPTR